MTHVIFNNARSDPVEIFTLAQLKAWSWLSSKRKNCIVFLLIVVLEFNYVFNFVEAKKS